MNNEHFQRVLRLISRTGDKGFIVDEIKEQMFAVMNIESYEKMLDQIDTAQLSGPQKEEEEEDGLADYVLDDILQIEESRKAVEPAVPEIPKTAVLPRKPAKKLEFSENLGEEESLKDNATAPEESLSDVPHDEEDEEKFYLEPVE